MYVLLEKFGYTTLNLFPHFNTLFITVNYLMTWDSFYLYILYLNIFMISNITLAVQYTHSSVLTKKRLYWSKTKSALRLLF